MKITPRLFNLLAIVLFLIFTSCELREKEFIKPIPIAGGATDITQISFKAHWYPVLGAEGYRIDVATDPEFSNILQTYNNKSVTDTFLKVEPLETLERYFYRVSFFRKKTQSGVSKAMSLVTKGLNAPTELSTSEIKDDSFLATWKILLGATNYTVQISTHENFSEINGEKKTSDNSILFSELKPNTLYFFRVKGDHKKSNSTFSVPQPIKTLDVPSPEALAATSTTPFSFTANWRSIPSVDKYFLQIAKDKSFNNIIYETVLSSNTYTINNLIPTIDYHYRVFSIKNGVQSEKASNVISEKLPSISNPTLHQVSKQSAFYFLATWDKVADADFYQIQVATDLGFTNILPAYNWAIVHENNIEITNLNHTTTYYMRVLSRTKNSSSSWSNVITVEPIIAKCKLLKIEAPWKINKFFINFTYDDIGRISTFIENREGTENDKAYQVIYFGKEVKTVNVFADQYFLKQSESWTAERSSDKKLSGWVIRDPEGKLLTYKKLFYTPEGKLNKIIDYADISATSVINRREMIFDWANEITAIKLNGKEEVRVRYDYRSGKPILNPLKLVNKDLCFFIGDESETRLPFVPRYIPSSIIDNGVQIGIYHEANNLALPILSITDVYVHYIYNDGCPITDK